MSRMGPQRITFEVAERSDLGGVLEIIPTLDGERLTSAVGAFETTQGYKPAAGYGGIIPSFFRFGPLDAHYLGRSMPRPGAKVPLLGCDCGEWGCWPLLATIRADDETVAWTDFEQPHRRQRDYTEFGPFIFERAHYDAALRDLETALGATS